MCGIAGVIIFKGSGEVDEDLRFRAIRSIMVNALINSRARGTDATGAALIGADKTYCLIKGGQDVLEFISRPVDVETPDTWVSKFLPEWERMGAETKTIIGHCRKKTVGDNINVNNNHPIIIKDESNVLIGAAQGTISNYEDLVKEHNYEMAGDVDSEIIFRLLYHKLGGNEMTSADLSWVGDQLEGTASFMVTDARYPNTVGLMKFDKPLELAFSKKLGCLFIIAEKKFLEESLGMYRLLRHWGYPHINDIDLQWKTLPESKVLVINSDQEVTDDTIAAIMDSITDTNPRPKPTAVKFYNNNWDEYLGFDQYSSVKWINGKKYWHDGKTGSYIDMSGNTPEENQVKDKPSSSVPPPATTTYSYSLGPQDFKDDSNYKALDSSYDLLDNSTSDLITTKSSDAITDQELIDDGSVATLEVLSEVSDLISDVTVSKYLKDYFDTYVGTDFIPDELLEGISNLVQDIFISVGPKIYVNGYEAQCDELGCADMDDRDDIGMVYEDYQKTLAEKSELEETVEKLEGKNSRATDIISVLTKLVALVAELARSKSESRTKSIHKSINTLFDNYIDNAEDMDAAEKNVIKLRSVIYKEKVREAE